MLKGLKIIKWILQRKSSLLIFSKLDNANHMLFDNTMSKVGLQGKTIMPFFMGLGCTIAGTTGTRVVDNWGQRVLAIAMSWAVPCAATLSVVPTIAIALFGSTGGFFVVITLVSIVFFVLTYGFSGSQESSTLYRLGVVIEPVTSFFGLKWQAFLAFCASAISKESLLVF